jgi:type IV secretion system protein VirB8
VNATKDIAAYFKEAASWDADRMALAARTQLIAWGVAAAGWICAVAAAIAIAFLTPLKTVTPYLIRVDNTTGLVDVVPQYAGTAELPEVTARAVLTHYIDVCERFIWPLAERDYEDCGAYNTARLNQRWAARWATANPASPLNLYKDGTSVVVRVVSISFFARASGITDLAQVRYLKVKKTIDGVEDQPTHWIASVQYVRGEPSKDPRVRQWNQLGYRILDFHSEPEIPTNELTQPAKRAR